MSNEEYRKKIEELNYYKGFHDGIIKVMDFLREDEVKDISENKNVDISEALKKINSIKVVRL